MKLIKLNKSEHGMDILVFRVTQDVNPHSQFHLGPALQTLTDGAPVYTIDSNKSKDLDL